MSILICARQLTHGYLNGKHERTVIERLDLDIARGEIVAIVGRSGSGKTTLLNIVGVMSRPQSGTLRIGDDDATIWNDSARSAFRRQRLGFVFQAYNLLPTLTVHENVALPLELNGLPDEGRTTQLLSTLGISALADRFPDQISGGEQQRTAIARAVVHRPDLIIADEPTGNLHREDGQRVIELFEQCARAAGAAVLMATHSLDMVGRADRVMTMQDGKLITLQP